MITKNQAQLIAHAISGHDRNWFGTSLDCPDSDEFKILVSGGLATSETPPKWMGDEVIYRITDDGRKALREWLDAQPQPPTPSRSKLRYAAYRRCEAEEGFGSWLKNSYWDDYRREQGV